MGYYIGVDIGGTTIKAGLVTHDGKLLSSESVPTPKVSGDGFCKGIVASVKKELDSAKLTFKDVDAIGIGAPGISDKTNNILVYVSTLDYGNAQIGDYLKRYTDAPVYIENDANCAALGEYYISSSDEKNMKCFIFVTVGTGVGGGIVIDGKLYTGSNGAGAEIGHIVTHRGGKPCGCGRNGCFERYASTSALVERATERRDEMGFPDGTGELNGKLIFDAALSGNAVACEIIDLWIDEIAEGIADLVNIFQPECIVIGGAVSAQGEYLISRIRERAMKNEYTHSLDLPKTQIIASSSGNSAGIIGAAMLAGR